MEHGVLPGGPFQHGQSDALGAVGGLGHLGLSEGRGLALVQVHHLRRGEVAIVDADLVDPALEVHVVLVGILADVHIER